MRNNNLIYISIILALLLLIKPVSGGIAIGQGSIKLKSLEKKTLCSICVYSTIPKPRTAEFHLSVTENLNKFIDKIYPNNFKLDEINCPSNPNERRKCIINECRNIKSRTAKTICMNIKGPFEFSKLNLCEKTLFGFKIKLPCEPEYIKYQGGIRNSVKVSASVIVEPVDFIVYFKPINSWYLVYLIIFILLVSLIVIKLRRKK